MEKIFTKLIFSEKFLNWKVEALGNFGQNLLAVAVLSCFQSCFFDFPYTLASGGENLQSNV